MIHTGRLVRDDATGLIQMGRDPVAVARALAEVLVVAPFLPPPPDAPSLPGDEKPATLAGYVSSLFAAWNWRAFEEGAARYARNVVAHKPGLRAARDPRGVAQLIIGLPAKMPDDLFRVEHVCWSDEADGIVAAARWRLDGTSSPYGALGKMLANRPVAMIGMSHFRFGGVSIVEEWTVFDEVAVLTQAYRA